MNIDLLDNGNSELKQSFLDTLSRFPSHQFVNLPSEVAAMLPSMCRIVNSEGQVVWGTYKYQELFSDKMSNSCC